MSCWILWSVGSRRLRSRSGRLLADEALDVGIASVREHAARRHEGVDPRGGVAIGGAGDVDEQAQLLLA